MRRLALALVLPVCWASLVALWKPSQGSVEPACNHIAHAASSDSILILDRSSMLWGGNPAKVGEQSSWSPIEVQGARPSPRLAPVTAYSSKRDTLIVWGGERLEPRGYLSDLYTFNAQSRYWSQPQRRLLDTKGGSDVQGNPAPEYRQAPSNDATVNGCVCKPMWETSVCGGSKRFYGCGMVPPCDGDNGGVMGNSWCLIVEATPACRGAGQDWDYCTINIPAPSAPAPSAPAPSAPAPSAGAVIPTRSTPTSQRPSPRPTPAQPTAPPPTPIPTPVPTAPTQRFVSTPSPTASPPIFWDPPTPNFWNPQTLLPTPKPSFGGSLSLSPTTSLSRIIRNSPVPRGWSEFCWTSNDESVLFLYGGAGSYDGIYGSNLDVSLADGWLLDTTTWNWSPLPTMVGYSLASNGSRVDLHNAVVPGLMGHRVGRVGRTIYVFGGYSCRKNAQTLRGGSECFVDSVYGFSVDQKQWWKVEESGFWPAGRAFHSLTVVGTQLWVFGGSAMNSFGSWEFFQDVSVFDTVSLRWSAVKQGTAPRPSGRWGHVATRWGEGLWIQGGCATDSQIYSDAFTLTLSQAITADNAQASGPGLIGAVPGANTSFAIEIRESFPGPLGSRSFGELLLAPGLRFDVSISPTTDVRILFVGDRYEVSFLAPRCSCSSYTVNVQLGGEHVFGSPFVASFLPAPLIVTISVLFDAPQSPDSLRDINNALCYFGARKFNVSVSDLQCTLGPASRRRLLAVSYDFTITAPSTSTLGQPLTTEDFAQDAILARALRDARGSIVKVAVSGESEDVYPLIPPASRSFEAAAGLSVLALNIIFICAITPCFVAVLYQEARGQSRASGTSLICLGALLALVGNFFVLGETSSSCHAAVWLLGLGFTILLTGLLIKAMYASSKQSNSGRSRNNFLTVCVVFGVVLVDIIINILWQALDPQRIVSQPLPVCISNTGVFEWIASIYVFVLGFCVLLAAFQSWCSSKELDRFNICVAAMNFLIVFVIALIVRVQNVDHNATVLVYALGVLWITMFTVIVVCVPVVCHCGKPHKQVETWKQPQIDPPHAHVEMQSVKQETKNVALENNPTVVKEESRTRSVPERETSRFKDDRIEERNDGLREKVDQKNVALRDEKREVVLEVDSHDTRDRGMERDGRDGRDHRDRDGRVRGEESRVETLDPVPTQQAQARMFQTPNHSQSARKHYHISRRMDRQERRERRGRSRRDGLSPHRSPSSRKETPREHHGLLRDSCTPLPPYPEASSPLPDIDYFRKKDTNKVRRSHSHHGHRSRRHDYPPSAPHHHVPSLRDFPSTPLFSSHYLPSASRLDPEPVRIRYTFKDVSSPHSTGSNTTAITFEDLNLDFVPERQPNTPSNLLAPREWRRHSLGVVTFS